MRVLGLKGAALAALGERPRGFAVAWLPFTASDEGVKLGEAMLNRFLMLYQKLVSNHTRGRKPRPCTFLLDNWAVI